MLTHLDASYPALILKASRGVIHHGAVGIARTLGRAGVPVYAVVEDACTPLAMSRYVRKAFVWDRWPNDPVTFLNSMAALGECIGRPTVIIPMDDLSAIFVAESSTQLASWFVMPPVPPLLPRQLANKVSFHALCNEAGIPIARSIVPHCIDDVRAFAASTEFPVVVKATEQWYLLQDRFSAKLIRNADELLEFYEGTIPEERHRLIIQEFVPGDDWISHGYYNSERNISLTFTGKKLRAYPAGAGSTASGISVGNASLRCETERFLRPLCYSGIFDIDWRKDSRDGVYKIVDCNPRIGQNFRMFENAAGIDVVRAQHLDLSGLRIEAADMIEGRLFIAESFWLQTLIRETPGKAPKPPVPRSSKELAWWSMYDPLPSAVMGIRLMIRILRRALGRWAAQRKASGAQRPGTHTHGIAH